MAPARRAAAPERPSHPGAGGRRAWAGTPPLPPPPAPAPAAGSPDGEPHGGPRCRRGSGPATPPAVHRPGRAAHRPASGHSSPGWAAAPSAEAALRNPADRDTSREERAQARGAGDPTDDRRGASHAGPRAGERPDPSRQRPGRPTLPRARGRRHPGRIGARWWGCWRCPGSLRRRSPPCRSGAPRHPIRQTA